MIILTEDQSAAYINRLREIIEGEANLWERIHHADLDGDYMDEEQCADHSRRLRQLLEPPYK